MPDTGAPWNIPYVAGTDLVADWPTDNQTMAEAIADALDMAGAGIGSNIVQATKTNTQTITSTSLVDVTNLSATITPSSATARVLVIARVNYALDGGERAGFSLLRDSTEIFLANAAGSRGRATHAAISTTSDLLLDATMVYLDSPATASATTYKVQGVVAANTLYINRGGTDSNSASYWRGTSSLLVVEVAA